MDIDLLSKMLRELIPEHETVSLPGIGEFAAVDMPASFSDKGYTINPPYRKLSFIPGNSDDGLLTDLYAGSNGIKTEEAKVIIRRYLDELQAVLNDRRTIAFPGLGRLRLTRSGTPLFIQDEDADIFPDGFGLMPISLKYHSASVPETPEPEIATIPEPEATVTPEPEIATIPEPEATVTPEPEASLTAEDIQEIPYSRPENPPARVKRKFHWDILVLVLILLILLSFASFLILAHVAPDFIDSILYTPEELRIINA